MSDSKKSLPLNEIEMKLFFRRFTSTQMSANQQTFQFLYTF